MNAEDQAALLASIAGVEQAAEAYLRAHRDESCVIAFVTQLHRAIDRVVQTASHQGVEMACKSGCNHCCHARVQATAPEVFLIAQVVRALGPAEHEAVVLRLRAHASSDDRLLSWQQRPPCPFLVDELCSIYALRPSVCRRAHSLDVKPCESGASEIPQNLKLVLDAQALCKGTAQAYSKIGLDASSYELGRAVLLVLSEPSAQARWYAGQALF